MMLLTQSYGGMRHPRPETSCPHVLKVLRFFIFCRFCTFECFIILDKPLCRVEISDFELLVMLFFFGFLGWFFCGETAALNLGCKPVRTSRSDRHNNPRTYLSPKYQPPPSVPLKPVVGNPLNYGKVTASAVSPIPVPDSTHPSGKLMGSPSYHFSEGLPSAHHQPLTMETRPSLNMGSVYPLYYGYEAREPQPRTTPRDTPCSDTIFVGRPVVQVPEPSGIVMWQSYSDGKFRHAASRLAEENALVTQGEAPGRECDLSLRLGQCLHPCSSSKSSSAYEIDDVGLVASPEGSKFSHLSLQRNKEFCFYPRETGYGNIESSSKCYVEGDDRRLEATLGKRKAPLGNNMEDGQFCRHLGVPSHRFTGRPGS